VARLVRVYGRRVTMAADSVASMMSEAVALQTSGALAAAVARYQEILRNNPSHADALYRLAQISCQQGAFSEGVGLVRQALAAEPASAKLHVLLGRALVELGEAQEALASFDRAISHDPQRADAYGNRGDLLARLGRFPEAIESYHHAIALAPDSVTNWCNLGAAQADLGRVEEALASYDRVIALAPEFVDAHLNRGRLLMRQGRGDQARGDQARGEEALASLQHAVTLAPASVPVLVSCGDALRTLGRVDEALAIYEQALAVAPQDLSALTGQVTALVALKRLDDALASLDRKLMLAAPDAESLSNRGFLLQSLDRHEEALASLDQALRIDPNHVDALTNRGAALAELNRPDDAIASYDRALAISPTHAPAHLNRAKALFALDRHTEALLSLERALSGDPATRVDSIYARGLALARLFRHDEAIAQFEQVLELRPDHPHVLAHITLSCLAICAWDKGAAVARRLYDGVQAGTSVVAPHMLLQMSWPPDVTLAATRQYIEREVPDGPPLDVVVSPGRSEKIRVAYLSPDFRVHPVGHLTAELFERHDRSRFEIIGLSFGPDDKSDLRSRIARSFDAFHDLRTASDREMATFIRQSGIDIAVDLAGHTDRSRTGVLRYRAAPVQVNYLGYAGTMGADFIDYIIADKVVLPFEEQPHYPERIVHLPDCFMVNDTTKTISSSTPSRTGEGLPEHGFVFASFNNAYKISAEIFQIWMRLLADVDGSVLWLSNFDPATNSNLRAAARAAGVDPARIVFAPRKQVLADHFARHRLAGLFLDTPGYNAHTTASDALWSGLPVLTCIGTMFPGRVAASLLHAVGLPELVTDNLDSYAALARKLARDPPLLAGIRQRLAQNRSTYPLFDTDRFARHIEQAYVTMRENHRRGDAPRSFSVAPIDSAGR
jgi:protein O-GlcNAc transferase